MDNGIICIYLSEYEKGRCGYILEKRQLFNMILCLNILYYIGRSFNTHLLLFLIFISGYKKILYMGVILFQMNLVSVFPYSLFISHFIFLFSNNKG